MNIYIYILVKIFCNIICYITNLKQDTKDQVMNKYVSINVRMHIVFSFVRTREQPEKMNVGESMDYNY